LKKYLFLYLKTGGGHLAPANAVAEKIRARRKGDAEIILSDGLADSNPLIRKAIVNGYKSAVNNAVWTFEFLYALHKIKIISKLTASIVSFFVFPGLEKQILHELPEKIIVFHFFLIKPVLLVLKKYSLDIPVIIVVTDPFTAHPIWFLEKDQHFIVFSEMLREKCIRRGIDLRKVKVFPFVLNRRFSKKIEDSKLLAIREKLGFEPGSKVILIMGGGDGMPKGKKILKKIITRNIDAEIAIVCGNNTKMYDYAMKLRNKFKVSKLKIYGYIDFVHSLISISDVVITKCGASTFMEILLLGKVPVINNYIWEQEKGNVEFVCRGKMGILEKRTNRIPDLLQRLLSDNEFYNSLSGNITKASISNGVGEVSDYILKYQ